MNLQRKVLISFQIDNVVDIITNSSSELFVLKGEEKSIIEEMIKNVYFNYESEYTLEKLSESSKQTKQSYIDWVYPSNDYNYRETREDKIKRLRNEAKSFNMKPEKFFTNWDERNDKYFYPNRSKKANKKIIKKLDPNKNIYCLWSKDENPNWEMQEKLMEIGTRYHLG